MPVLVLGLATTFLGFFMNIFMQIRQKFLINFWHTGKTIIALGFLSAIYFGIFGGVWAVTGELTRWGGEILELFGKDLSDYSYYQKQNLNGNILTRKDGIMMIGMFFGSLIAALWANKVKIRFPASKIRIFQAIVGGILSGFGARLAFGCNLANFFTGIPYFSFHPWIFCVFMIIGIYCAVKVDSLPFFKPRAKLQKLGKNGLGITVDNNRVKRHITYGFVAFAVFLLFLLFIATQNYKPLLWLALIFGFAFGFLISRGQVCFTSCFRDLFLFGRMIATKGAIFGMLVATIIAFLFIVFNNTPIKIVEISPALCIGAFLFGFGIVFAGGCECGWTYRAFEGQIHFMIVGVANVIGTMILALNYDYFPKSFTSGVKINLLELFGNYGGLIINILLLMIGLYIVTKYCKNFKRKI